MIFGVRDVALDNTFTLLEHDAISFRVRDVTLDDTFTLLLHDIIAFGGSHTHMCHFLREVLMYFHFIFMLEAILGVNLDLSTFYHEYFTFLWVFED
jgi:hypothetical protein